MIGVCVNRNNYPKEDASEFDLTKDNLPIPPSKSLVEIYFSIERGFDCFI